MNWKTVLLVALVVLLVLIGLPMLMPGGAMGCPDCGPATTVASVCVVAVLSGLLWGIAALSVLLFVGRNDPRLLLRAVFFDRPPRLA